MFAPGHPVVRVKWGMGTFWKCVLVKFVLNKFVLTKDLVYLVFLQIILKSSVPAFRMVFSSSKDSFGKLCSFPAAAACKSQGRRNVWGPGDHLVHTNLYSSGDKWSEFSLYFRRPMLEFCNTRLSSLTRFPIFIELTLKCRISANSFCGNYSFLNLEFQIVNKLNFCCGNYSREETIQRQKLFAKMMMNY